MLTLATFVFFVYFLFFKHSWKALLYFLLLVPMFFLDFLILAVVRCIQYPDRLQIFLDNVSSLTF